MAFDKAKIEELLQKDLFKELGLDKLPLEEQMSFMDDMGKVVAEGIWIRVLENLTDADQTELENILGTSVDGAEAMEFLNKKIPNLQELIDEEVANYKALMIGA